jgi:hypothetical protein
MDRIVFGFSGWDQPVQADPTTTACLTTFPSCSSMICVRWMPASNAVQPVGTHGEKCSLSASSLGPSSDSRMNYWYIQPAEIVYHVQPPRPVRGAST